MTQHRFNPAARPCAALLAVSMSIALPVLAQSNDAAVGQVSLLIGEARVVHANGAREALKRGAPILVGDRVETSANGHVHVRFVDHAAVSVRPESVLEVQAYHFDAQRPQDNEVRLRVEQGTSRSISGAATEADKTRFRLNTPIAAIGVRGTDFIVQADPSGVRATVSDGAIVVGALGGACLATALGPCAGGDVRVLSASMGRLMAEVRPGDHVTRIVPAAGALLTNAAYGAEERVAARTAAESAARSVGLLAAEPTPSALQRGNDRTAAELLTIAAANVPDLNRASDPSGQLIWGRWSVSPSVDDKLSVPFSIASTGRHITVADDRGGLFRTDDPSNPQHLLSDALNAKVDFRLSRASASFETGSRTEAASVDGGTLTLDFARRTFATALALSSATAGKAELRMGGDVRTDGTFAVKDVDQRIAGAVTLDGKEAGYLFERNVVGGLFRGKTLWGR
ncbi:MAG: FecR domain-containing protein [Ideonella sp.]|nr:FecR domain-containing protein [Ideonella sp.]